MWGDIIPVLLCATLLSKAGSNWLETIIASHLSLFWLISFLFLFHLHVCWKQKRGGMSLMALAFYARTAGHANPCSSDSTSPLRSGPEFISRLDYISPTPYSTNAHLKLVFSGEERESEQGQGFQSALRPLHLIPCLLCGCPSSLSLKTQVPRRRVGHPCSVAPPGPAPGSRPAVPFPALVPLLPSILAHWQGCRELH